jgi:N-acetylneuraminic acid mutarotase
MIVSFSGPKRRDAASFVIDGKAYIVSGIDNGVYLDDIFEYDPLTGSWTEKREISDSDDDLSYDDDYTTIARIDGVGYTIDGIGYLSTGSVGSMLTNIWAYNPQTDLWEERTSFEGSARTNAVGFVINAQGYIATGRSSSYYYDDLWCFDPTLEYDESLKVPSTDSY